MTGEISPRLGDIFLVKTKLGVPYFSTLQEPTLRLAESSLAVGASGNRPLWDFPRLMASLEARSPSPIQRLTFFRGEPLPACPEPENAAAMPASVTPPQHSAGSLDYYI